MKKMNLIFSLVAMIFLAITSDAKAASTFEVITQSNFIMIKMQSNTDDKVKLKVVSDKGQVLYSQFTTLDKLEGRKYDLKEFPTGDYVLEITIENAFYLHPFTKSKAGLTIDASLASTIFAPTMKQTNAFVDLNMLCLADCQTSIRVYDINGETLYWDKEVKGQKIEKRIDLSQVIPGKYTVSVRVVSSNFEEVFIKTFDTYSASLVL